jgi:hypothetical protein
MIKTLQLFFLAIYRIVFNHEKLEPTLFRISCHSFGRIWSMCLDAFQCIGLHILEKARSSNLKRKE